MRVLSRCTSLVVNCVTNVLVIVCICQLRVRGGESLNNLKQIRRLFCVS